MSKMFFSMLAVFAEFEADLLKMRTREGMAIARTRGKLKGRAAPSSSPPASRPNWYACTPPATTPSSNSWRSSPSAAPPSTASWTAAAQASVRVRTPRTDPPVPAGHEVGDDQTAEASQHHSPTQRTWATATATASRDSRVRVLFSARSSAAVSSTDARAEEESNGQ